MGRAVTCGQVRWYFFFSASFLRGLSNHVIQFLFFINVVGVVSYLVLSNKFPFRDMSRESLYYSIVTGDCSFPTTIWGAISEEGKDFVQKLLTVDPKERPTAAKALQHPWLADARRQRASMGIKTSPSKEEQLAVAADESARFALTNMQNFKKSRLQEAVKMFIKSQLLLSEEKKAIDNVFRDLGKNAHRPLATGRQSWIVLTLSLSNQTDITCNGKLSKPEVRAAYFKFFKRRLEDDELDDLFHRVDSTGTGFIEYSDFVIATMNEKVLLNRDKLKKAVSTKLIVSEDNLSIADCFQDSHASLYLLLLV